MSFLRYQSPAPDRRGRRIGVFGLVNMLANRGLLTADEERFRRLNNDWYDATYVNPSHVDPSVYEHLLAAAWFKTSASHLFERVPVYLEILAAHNLPCERFESADPGRVLYEDEHQVVVVPHTDSVEEPTVLMWLPPVSP
jgi:hypothetical protein